jgi:ribonuclease T1
MSLAASVASGPVAATSAGPTPNWKRERWSPGVCRLAARWLLVGATLGALLVAPPVEARGPDVPSRADVVSLAELPPEARETHRRILAGGPFPYRKDGTVFFNRERLLPPRPRGQYREYTVRTPGARNRGARRIVCGGLPPTAPEACYYTADHYASFRRIQP